MDPLNSTTTRSNRPTAMTSPSHVSLVERDTRFGRRGRGRGLRLQHPYMQDRKGDNGMSPKMMDVGWMDSWCRRARVHII